jgi:hypothetical protein
MSFSESVLGAKLGDRGKGWEVKANKKGFSCVVRCSPDGAHIPFADHPMMTSPSHHLTISRSRFVYLLVSNRYCVYNGTFTIQGNSDQYDDQSNSYQKCDPMLVWQGKKAFASFGGETNNVWTIKSDPKRDWGGGYAVTIAPSSGRGYLTPTTSISYDKWGDPDTGAPINMKLKKNKVYYRFYQAESDETPEGETNCLQVDLYPRKRGMDASIHTSVCEGNQVDLVWDPIEPSDWILTPV